MSHVSTNAVAVPLDLKRALARNKRALMLWQSLTPLAQRDFISWIDSAKQAVTRKKRVESVPSRLLSGKRRPCCYAVVPMELYKALGANAKAKALWVSLSASEKRDAVEQLGAVRSADALSRQIEKELQGFVMKRRVTLSITKRAS